LSDRLCDANLGALSPSVIKPKYDRSATRIGIVHFGPGAFHRAHQAFYADQMLALDPSLAISAVSLRSDDLRIALSPQDGLYSLTERQPEVAIRVVGAIKEVLTAPRQSAKVFARLTDPAVRFLSATVTEKGYCLTPGGDLDTDHPDIRADLADLAHPRTLIGWLVEGLRRRRAASAGGLVALSCDNLSGNGAHWRRAVQQFAVASGQGDLARWIENEVAFPDSMVDAITPATDDSLRTEAAARLGLSDAGPVQRERFVQWVIGRDLGRDVDTFAEAGVTVTDDVAGFERAKLRLLNGAHSTIAYVGLTMAHETVAQAMADPALGAFVEQLMRRDITASLRSKPGLDLEAYISEVLARLRNPAIVHRLSQIACDGSQKLPLRLLETIAEGLAEGRSIDRLSMGVAAWMIFVRQQSKKGIRLIDPLAGRLSEIGAGCLGQAAFDVPRFLKLEAVFSNRLATDPRLRAALEAAYAALDEDPRRAIAAERET